MTSPCLLPQARPVGLYALSVSLGLPRNWLRDEALAGRIPCLKVGKRLLFNRDAVERTLLERAGAVDQEARSDAS